MVNLYRLICAFLLCVVSFAALADGGPFPAKMEQPTGNCTPANYPRGYTSDPGISASWKCGGEGRLQRQCGWSYVAPKYGWDGTEANGVFAGQCNTPEPVYSCPGGANSSGSGSATVCTCAAGLRPFDGQCVATPACPDGQHEEGGLCVPDKCKPNETRVNGVCVPEPPCPAGQTRIRGKCERDKCPKAGSPAGDGWEMTSASPEFACESTGISFEGSVQYCMIKVTNTVDVTYNGKTSYFGTGRYTGGQCDGGSGGGDGDGGNPDPNNPGNPGDPKPPGKPETPGTGPGGPGTGPKPPDKDNPPPKPPDPVPPVDDHCPPGTQKYSNGNCYPPTPTPKPPDDNGNCPTGTLKVGSTCVTPSPPGKPVPEKPNTDGSCPRDFHRDGKWCVKDPVPSDGDKCPEGFQHVNGSCIFNPGVPGGDGTGGGGGDGDGDGEKGTFGGSCKAGFACEGDAIQCAIAKDQHRRACQLIDDESAESKLYNENKNKTGDQTGDLPGNKTESIAGKISSVDALGAGNAGLSDVQVTVMGKAISLPFSLLNQYLAALGNVLLAVSFLLAFRIISRG